MDWLSSLLNIQSSIQAIIIVALICGIGLWLGKIRLGGISLGIAFVFFFGIFVGSLHLEIDHEMLDYCETFGLVLFVYALGLHVGPNFFGSLRAEGTALNLWSLGVIFLGTLLAVVLSYLTPIPMSDMIGVLCGATTNTPALGAAQQALEHAGVGGGRAALATAVTYPLGVLGVILAMMFIRKFFVKPDDLKLRHEGDEDHTFVGQYVVVNPALEGRTLAQIARATQAKFIVSRIWQPGTNDGAFGKYKALYGRQCLGRDQQRGGDGYGDALRPGGAEGLEQVEDRLEPHRRQRREPHPCPHAHGPQRPQTRAVSSARRLWRQREPHHPW